MVVGGVCGVVVGGGGLRRVRRGGRIRVGVVGGAAGAGLDETLEGRRVDEVGGGGWEAGARGGGEGVGVVGGVVLRGVFVAGGGFQGDGVAAAAAAAAAVAHSRQ